MKPTFFRAACALAAFFLGVALATLPPAPRTEMASGPQTQGAPGVRESFAPPASPGQPRKAERRVGQEEVLDIRGVGRVRVTAYETEGEYSRLVFTDAESGEELFSALCGDSDSYNPSLRFKVMHVPGLPDPLVVAVSLSPGGSDASWEATAVGAVDGELQVLTYERLRTSNQGGFYFGDLGGGLGPGAAAWSFIWGEGRGHYGEHQYEMTLYRWNPLTARLEWHRAMRTEREFYPASRGVRSLGFRFDDLRKAIPYYADMGEW